MKKKFVKLLAVLLSAILLAGMLPLAGLAADDELVISKLITPIRTPYPLRRQPQEILPLQFLILMYQPHLTYQQGLILPRPPVLTML